MLHIRCAKKGNAMSDTMEVLALDKGAGKRDGQLTFTDYTCFWPLSLRWGVGYADDLISTRDSMPRLWSVNPPASGRVFPKIYVKIA